MPKLSHVIPSPVICPPAKFSLISFEQSNPPGSTTVWPRSICSAITYAQSSYPHLSLLEIVHLSVVLIFHQLQGIVDLHEDANGYRVGHILQARLINGSPTASFCQVGHEWRQRARVADSEHLQGRLSRTRDALLQGFVSRQSNSNPPSRIGADERKLAVI